FGPMRSIFPFNSAVAWTSIATGRDPGAHGIFDFMLPHPNEYQLRAATGADRRAPALWSIASAAGARVAVVNIPMTFPAEQVDGIMVSVMDAPVVDRRAVWPAAFLDDLRRLAPGYRIQSSADIRAAQGDWAGAEREIHQADVARNELVVQL